MRLHGRMRWKTFENHKKVKYLNIIEIKNLVLLLLLEKTGLFIAAGECSLLEFNALIAIPHTSGLQVKAFFWGFLRT